EAERAEDARHPAIREIDRTPSHKAGILHHPYYKDTEPCPDITCRIGESAKSPCTNLKQPGLQAGSSPCMSYGVSVSDTHDSLVSVASLLLHRCSPRACSASPIERAGV